MKKKRLYTLLCFLCFFQISFAQNYYFETISPEAGFAFDAVYTISEDCNGFVWFGCNNGLYYYNTSTISKVNLLPEKQNHSQSLRITSIYHDLNCNLWVCTEAGLFLRDENENRFSKIEMFSSDSSYSTLTYIEQILQFDENLFFIVVNSRAYYFNKEEKILHPVNFENPETSGKITTLSYDSRGNFLFGNYAGKVYIASHPAEQFQILYDSGSDVVTSICDDNNKYYIGFGNKGIEVINIIGDKIFDLNKQQKNQQYLPNNRVRTIVKMGNGEIWIGTYQGIVIIDKNSKNTIIDNENNELPHNSIYVLHKGKNDGIWVGTWAGGIAYYRENNYRFNHIVKIPEENKNKSVVSSFLEDYNGNMWIGSEQGGIAIFNPFGHFFVKSPTALNNINLLRIKSLERAGDDKMIIGTFNQGLWIYEIKSQKLTNISNASLPEETIISTLSANKEELWLGTRGARHSLFRYSFADKKFQYYDLASGIDNSRTILRVWKVLLDSSMKLWACTDEGLYFKYKNDSAFNKCFVNDTLYGLDQTMIYTVYEDKNEQIWIGTKGKGVFKFNPENETLIKYENNYYRNIDVFGIAEDEQQKIWYSTDNGIFCFDPSTEKTTRYSNVDGLSGEQFTPNSIAAGSSGEIYFGSANGFCFVNPEKIKINEVKPEIFLSKLLVNNESFYGKDGIQANSSIIEEINDITLQHSQNSLTFGVAANNFIKPVKNRFKYRLVNYEENWIEAGLNQDITFTKIPPGNYLLEVLGSNNDNIWAESPLQIRINILYPFWQKWYALLFYFLLVVFIAYLTLKEIRLRLKLRKEILAERYKAEAQEQLYEQKTRFFTNVSHEIRTPLNLILSPLNNLLNKFQFDEKVYGQLLIIQRNSQRLLRLTNQILDFRLLEVNKLAAHYQKSDIVKICNEVVHCFEMLIKEKQINFIFSSNYKSLFIDADPDMIEKIVYNLVSNALKFSNEKGQVFLTIESRELEEDSYEGFVSAGNMFKGKSLEIKVRDFGKGIKADLLPTILDRFSTDPTQKETGTGIGLHLCQEYARMHNGNLLVSSAEGKGSTFILNIPFQKNSQYEKTTFVKQMLFENGNEFDIAEPVKTNGYSNRKVVLLAEDNDELRNYLKNYLNQYYKVITAKNGLQAYEIAKEVVPDIIITDILMPVKDGMELITEIKSKSQTGDIPIIVLTALSESKYQKESLHKGVDSYLVKPVDETLLIAQIENILNNRAILAKRLHPTNNLQAEDLNSSKSFTQKVESIIEKNLRNSKFSMDTLLESLNISRSTFHRKIKLISNQSPSEFIRDIRLKNAVELMKSGNLNVDEIGTYVGFNSTSYFIRSFKKKYGKTPKEYFKQVKN